MNALWLWVSLAGAADGPPPLAPAGRIVEVEVYPDRARVVREIRVQVEPGVTVVNFPDLPPTLDTRTLAADGDGPAGTRILGLDHSTRELVEDRRARVAELEALLLAVSEEAVAATDRRDAAAAEKSFLDRLNAAAAQQLSAELLFAEETVKDAEAMAQLLRTRYPEVQEQVRAANIELRDIQARRSALQRELDTVRGLSQWSRHDVAVQVEASQAGAATVRLAYVLPGASWVPSWDARANAEASEVQLTLHAQVAQTTGEDWSEARLALSTASPAEGVSPPTVEPFWLEPGYAWQAEVYYPKEKGRGSEDELWAEEAMAPSMDADYGGGMAAPEPEPMEAVVAVVQERPVAASFEVPVPTTIPGDGSRRRVQVTQLALATAPVHVVAPGLDSGVFLVARGTWEAGWPMLGGETSAFLGEAFVGTAWLPRVGTGAELEFGFGRDDRLELTRSVQRDLTTEPDWRGRVTLDRSWTDTVRNGGPAPVVVELRDRLPVSKNSAYTVRATGEAPTEIEADGRQTFTLSVPAGAEAAVTHGWYVRWPRKSPPGSLP